MRVKSVTEGLPCSDMRLRRPTLTDVAKRAAVSPSAASFVLTGREDMRISEQARQRVLRAAHELGYRPNLTARSLRTSVTRTVALVSDTIATDQYAGMIVHGALAAAMEEEHLLLLAETGGDREAESRLVEHFLARQVDGFLYASMHTRELTVPPALAGQRVVLVNCSDPASRLPAVIPDELAAGAEAARVLLDAGHVDGIHLVGERAEHTIAGRERVAGLDAALAGEGVRLEGQIACAWWPEAAYEAVGRFLAAGGRPGALVCLNDRLALGAYQALGDAGLRVPQDVSVVSFDDSELATWLWPALTSVGLPHRLLGRRGVELLLKEPEATGVERAPMPVRERASVGPPAPRGRVASAG